MLFGELVMAVSCHFTHALNVYSVDNIQIIM